MNVEIYPREGTETNIKIRFNVFVKLKFIPVRGRKPAGFVRFGRTLRLKFIPVRGRKLLHMPEIC